MSQATVNLAPAEAKYTFDNGPMTVELCTVRKGLDDLGGGFIRFDNGGKTDPWRLPYEEIIVVISGELTLHVEGGESITAPAGAVVTIAKGAGVVYEGTPGTRGFYALTPADWHKRYPHGLPETEN
ncbi:Ethanolamine utilization protein EutQ [Nocardia cerradoensis]|uniref:Ethanolamine utilization protein EutQ n=1 Tax=Nocardia cerradoensis TaxID=85688 RepID=A0A231GX96_9NOCA|nr:cupin domain-containing protein [Nocardia cerradoensis]OXR41226.1 Ethanolamine utilization protein EutQ [Nocardia cerradoensis]